MALFISTYRILLHHHVRSTQRVHIISLFLSSHKQISNGTPTLDQRPNSTILNSKYRNP